MSDSSSQTPPPPPLPEPRKLALATLAACLVAGVVLVVAILPAEYGVDPTGLGHLTGFSRLGHESGNAPTSTDGREASRTAHAVEASWEVVERVVAVETGYNEGNFVTSRVVLPLNVTNLTHVTARLEWWDNDTIDGQRTGPDRFEIGIRAPDGRASQLVQADNAPSGYGNVTTSLAWRAVPAVERNATQGTLTFPVLAPDESSHGTWTFTVRSYGAQGLPNGTHEDPGNAWRLTITAQSYALTLREADGALGDRVQLTLGRNEGVEYKFHLQPGATLAYAWTATGPLYWDLHAEEDGKNPDDFTRYAEGTSRGESGSLMASFAGRHGWYWLNRGEAPVTIVLETRGEYAIVGIPR